jgi:hypothetical protein
MLRRGIREMLQRGRCLMGKPGGGEFRVTDVHFLEIFQPPQAPVGAYAAQIECRDAKGFRADLAVPGVKPAKVEIRLAIGQFARFDRMGVIDQKHEHIPVRGIERRRFLGNIDERVVGHARPLDRPRNFPARIADPITGKSHDGLHQFMVPDPAIIGACRRAQFGAAAVCLQQFHLFAAMGDEAMLQVDPGKGGRKLAQIGGRRTDKAGHLAKGPVGRGNRALVTRRHQHQAFGIVAFGFNPDRTAFDDAGRGPVSPQAHAVMKRGERKEFLVIRAREPFRRYPAAHASA